MIYYLAIDIEKGENSYNKYYIFTQTDYIFRSRYNIVVQTLKLDKKINTVGLVWLSKDKLLSLL